MDYCLYQTFDNDYPALLAPEDSDAADPSGQQVYGRCRVMCFHPRHDLTLARMPHDDIVAVINGWQDVYREEGEAIRKMQKDLKGEDEGHVQIFEVGSSHPACF
jgi:UDPglucose--hexose-1-phosphate uridylyltransferase